MVAVGERALKRLEHYRADAFAGHVAVAALAEAAAAPVAGGEAPLAQLYVFLRMHRDVDPAGERDLALAAAQAGTGQVDRGQRRRAHAVDRHARPLPVEEVRDPVGDRSMRGG